MSEMNNLQKALLVIEEERSHKYDDLYEVPEPHKFSHSYLKRRKEIIRMCEEGQSGIIRAVPNYRRAHRLGLRTILVAALIMLLATASVIAITKPHIYYVIKEKIDSWKITFIEEDNDDGDRNFEIVKPIIPEGFTVTQEEELENNYFLLVENAAGDAITYDQRLPEGAACYKL